MPDREQLEHDKRLDLLNPGEYRLWHDACQVMIPIGKSTTQPLRKEVIPQNTRVYGEIQKGFFKPPEADFTNAEVVPKRFDRYFLRTWRNGEDLPSEEPGLDYDNDLGLKQIWIDCLLTFDFNDGTGLNSVRGYYQGVIPLILMQDFPDTGSKMWISETQEFSRSYKADKMEVYGNFRMGTLNTAQEDDILGFRFDTGFKVNDELMLYLYVDNVFVRYGNSEIKILEENNDQNFTLSLISNRTKFKVVGGSL